MLHHEPCPWPKKLVKPCTPMVAIPKTDRIISIATHNSVIRSIPTLDSNLQLGGSPLQTRVPCPNPTSTFSASEKSENARTAWSKMEFIPTIHPNPWHLPTRRTPSSPLQGGGMGVVKQMMFDKKAPNKTCRMTLCTSPATQDCKIRIDIPSKKMVMANCSESIHHPSYGDERD